MERNHQQADDHVRQGQVRNEEVRDGLKHQGRTKANHHICANHLNRQNKDLHAATGEDDEDDGGVTEDRREGGGAVDHG